MREVRLMRRGKPTFVPRHTKRHHAETAGSTRSAAVEAQAHARKKRKCMLVEEWHSRHHAAVKKDLLIFIFHLTLFTESRYY